MLSLSLVSLARSSRAEEPPAAPPEAEAAPSPAPSPDTQPPKHALSLGARVSVGIPYGGVNANTSLPDIYAAAIPIQLDAGYKPSPTWYFGAYYVFAPAFLGARTHDGDHVVAGGAGLLAHYHFRPYGRCDPWLGLGIGYDSATFTSKSSSLGLVSNSYNGFEFVDLQLGVDLKRTPRFAFGPVLSASLSDYLGGTLVLNDGSRVSSSSSELHGLVTVGVRAVYDNPL